MKATILVILFLFSCVSCREHKINSGDYSVINGIIWRDFDCEISPGIKGNFSIYLMNFEQVTYFRVYGKIKETLAELHNCTNYYPDTCYLSTKGAGLSFDRYYCLVINRGETSNLYQQGILRTLIIPSTIEKAMGISLGIAIITTGFVFIWCMACLETKTHRKIPRAKKDC